MRLSVDIQVFISTFGAHPAGTACLRKKVRRLGRKDDQSLPSTAKVKNAWVSTSTAP